MRSVRRERNKARSKSQAMIKGGIYDYYIEPSELSALVELINRASAKQLPFLLDALLTKKELVDITRRITIAKMILDDKTYAEISENINTSHNTISFVQSSLADYDGLLKKVLSRSGLTHTHSDWIISATEKRIFDRIKKGK